MVDKNILIPEQPKEYKQQNELVARYTYALELGQQLLKRFKVAQDKRKQFETIWQTVSNYVLPYRGGFYSITNSGSITPYDRNVAIYDDTATNALLKAASAMYSYTANPATQWFHFGLQAAGQTKDKDKTVHQLLENREVRDWLSEVEEITAKYINSNAQEGFHALAQEVLAYSTSALYVVEDPFSDQFLTIQPISIRDLYILNGVAGNPEEVYRAVVLTNEQVVKQIGSVMGAMIPKEILDGAAKDPLKERTLIHCVYPRQMYDPKDESGKGKPFASVWIDYTSKQVLLESGFDEMPYSIARINVPAGYVYGFAPAMNIRHTIQSLNKLAKQKLVAGDLALMPPMNVPMDSYLNPLSLKPAALNYHEPDAQFRAEPMHTIGNYQINTETINDARNQVKQGLLIDLVEQTNKDNTYQAMQEQLLQLKLMSPWQGGIEKWCLRPLVIRVFNILRRRGGIIPDPPEVLQKAMMDKKVRMQIDYDSPMSRAQQHFKLTAIEQTMAFVAPLAQLGALEAINMDRLIKLYVELVGAPVKILYTEEEIEQKRQEAEAAQQQAMAMQQQQMAMQQQQAQASSTRDYSEALANAQGAAQAAQESGQDLTQLLGGGGFA